MANALYELGNNPHVQEKLRLEIAETIAEKKIINFETLNEMPYLDQVFHGNLFFFI